MKKYAVLALFVALAPLVSAKDKAEVTYVGQGRYVCEGKSAACAQIEQSNRALEREQRAREEARLEREREQRRVNSGKAGSGAIFDQALERFFR